MIGSAWCITTPAGYQARRQQRPGRLNETSAVIERAGMYYGQCSELCGAYHGFMPIGIQAVELDDYLVWLDSLAD